MKKLFFALPMMALLCISCTKTEQQPTQSQSSNAMETTASLRSNARHTLCMYWWTGDPYEHACIDYTVTDSLCYIILGCEDLNSFPVDVDIDIDFNNNQGTLTQILIPQSSLSTMALQKRFEDYLTRGFISFAFDSPIDDNELLSVLTSDYIPAGSYPISLSDTTIVITISETPTPGGPIGNHE